jgi:hypothetical protein
MSETVYQYFEVDVPPGVVRSCKNGGTGVVCCRIDRPAKYDPKAEYKVAFSFCSPADQFSRRGVMNSRGAIETLGAHGLLSKRMDDGHFVTVNLRSKKPLHEVAFYGLRKLLRAQEEAKQAGLARHNDQLAWPAKAVPQWALSKLQRGDDGTPRTIKMRSRNYERTLQPQKHQ